MNRALRPVVLALVSGLLATSCAGWKPIVKDIDTAAIILCDVFYSQQHPAMSADEVEAYFCATANQIAPFLAAAKGIEVKLATP